MADLMASYFSKQITLERGVEVEGRVIAITDSEVVLDLGTKAEGIIAKKELSDEQISGLKIGGLVHSFVLMPESSSGQVILTPLKSTLLNIKGRNKRDSAQLKRWQKIIAAFERKRNLFGEVAEVNKGGLLLEMSDSVGGHGNIRGFIPSSQIGLDHLKGVSSLEELIGKKLEVSVIEVDAGENRLICSARQSISDKAHTKLAQYNVGDAVSGEVALATPFGLFIDLDGVEGFVFPQEISWEEKENPTGGYNAGEKIEAKVIGKDENLGRVNLSLRQLEKDPFEEAAQDFQSDDVVTGVVTEVTHNGYSVRLERDIVGFVPNEKVETGGYHVGQSTNFLVDSIDMRNRRVNLAPFLTTTKGLIYK